jgi:hypothetical protein
MRRRPSSWRPGHSALVMRGVDGDPCPVRGHISAERKPIRQWRRRAVAAAAQLGGDQTKRPQGMTWGSVDGRNPRGGGGVNRTAWASATSAAPRLCLVARLSEA